MFQHSMTEFQICGLQLNNLPQFWLSSYQAFENVTRIIGRLTITNNQYIYTLQFFSSLVEVFCLT